MISPFSHCLLLFTVIIHSNTHKKLIHTYTHDSVFSTGGQGTGWITPWNSQKSQNSFVFMKFSTIFSKFLLVTEPPWGTLHNRDKDRERGTHNTHTQTHMCRRLFFLLFFYYFFEITYFKGVLFIPHNMYISCNIF